MAGSEHWLTIGLILILLAVVLVIMAIAFRALQDRKTVEQTPHGSGGHERQHGFGQGHSSRVDSGSTRPRSSPKHDPRPDMGVGVEDDRMGSADSGRRGGTGSTPGGSGFNRDL